MINCAGWKEFYLEDLFEIGGSKTTPVDELEGYGSGNYPYVTTKASNNGVDGFYDYHTEEGNCLTIDSAVIGYCTYQELPFSASDHVEILRPKFAMNQNIALFFVTIINLDTYRYSYGRKRSQKQIKKDIVKLPVKNDGTPDWDYMDKYIEEIQSRERESSSNLKDSLKTSLINQEKLSINDWKEFRLGDLFNDIYKGHAYVKGELEEAGVESKVIFVSRTDEENGCDAFLAGDINDYDYEKGNAMIIGDTTSTCFYQEEDFVCGDHIVVLRADWLNKYTGLFMKTLLEKERFKYSYGRSFKMDLIKKTLVKLPTNKEGNPDWNYIKNYIKSIPYSDRI